MKIRQGFVSNSSSASFVIKLNKLTPIQIHMIEEHIFYANAIDAGNRFAKKEDDEYAPTSKYGWYEPWKIITDAKAGEIRGSTGMTNFDMHAFLTDIGVNQFDIESTES